MKKCRHMLHKKSSKSVLTSKLLDMKKTASNCGGFFMNKKTPVKECVFGMYFPASHVLREAGVNSFVVEEVSLPEEFFRVSLVLDQTVTERAVAVD